MKKEFLRYTPEELLEEHDFIAWVLWQKNQAEWTRFLAEHPEFKSKTNKARKIVELFNDLHHSMSEDDILRIWKNIENYNDQLQKKSRQIKLNRFMRYAAILVVALTIGGIGFWSITQNYRNYHFSNSDVIKNEDAQLLLSDGTKVDLENENSKINLKEEEKIIIDNDQIINLQKAKPEDRSKMNEVIIPYGKKSQLELEDGTKVWLNAGSKMAFPTKFTGKKRAVYLEGEAYFEVVHNEDVPFLVNTKDITVKVLGTKFNLSAYGSDKSTETVLVEGKVTVSKRSALGFMDRETVIKPNQKATYNKVDKTISIADEADIELDIAWTEGMLKFSHQNLKDVLVKLQRFYNIQFIYDRDFATYDIITGKLDLNGSVENAMLALADVAHIKYRINGSLIYIEKK